MKQRLKGALLMKCKYVGEAPDVLGTNPNLRNRMPPPRALAHLFPPRGLEIHANFLKGNAQIAEERSGRLAIGAQRGTVHENRGHQPRPFTSGREAARQAARPPSRRSTGSNLCLRSTVPAAPACWPC